MSPTAGSSVSTGAFALVWNAFVAFWTVGALAGGGVLFALFSIPFWLAGAQLAKASVAGAFLRRVGSVRACLCLRQHVRVLACLSACGAGSFTRGVFDTCAYDPLLPPPHGHPEHTLRRA